MFEGGAVTLNLSISDYILAFFAGENSSKLIK